MPARHALLVFLAGLVGAVLAGCGSEGGLDRTDGQAVYRAAMHAVHDADWDTLRGLLTKDARFALERDLRRLQTDLAAPAKGSELHKRVRERLGDRTDEAIRAAVKGDLRDVLRFFVTTWPREREPSPRRLKMDAFTMEMLYEAPGGVLRPVKLVRRGGRWYVRELQL